MTFNEIMVSVTEYARRKNLKLISVKETYVVKPFKRRFEVVYEAQDGTQIVRTTEVTQ